MEYRYNDLKEFLIKNGIKKEVGVGNNKRTVYTYNLGSKCFKTQDLPITDYYFCISYNGLNADCHRYGDCYDYIRYNETTDCIQVARELTLKWKTLTFNEDGRVKTRKGYYDCIFLNAYENKEYCEIYYYEHINDAIKKLKENIKSSKSNIKELEKRIKNYESTLEKLEDKLEEILRNDEK